MRFRQNAKLSRRYIGPFKVRSKVGDVDYRLILPLKLSGICNVFHVSILKKFADHSYVLVHVSLEIKEDAPSMEKHVKIIDIKGKFLGPGPFIGLKLYGKI